MHLGLRLPGRAVGAVAGTDAVAVLASGGLDSAILVAQLVSEGREVTPIYVRFGLAWEDVEVRHLGRFLASLPPPEAKPLVVLDLPVADIYGTHWSVTGQDVPDGDSPDEAVYLPGRNLLLLAKSSVWCALNGIPTIALGTLAANPFPDADREFFAGFSALAGRALGCPLEVITPFAGRAKHEVLDIGRRSPSTSPSPASRRARSAIADTATNVPNVSSPSDSWAFPTPPSTPRRERLGRRFIAPVSFGLGDLVVSLPVVQAAVTAGERSGTEVWLVARSPSQVALAERVRAWPAPWPRATSPSAARRADRPA